MSSTARLDDRGVTEHDETDDVPTGPEQLAAARLRICGDAWINSTKSARTG